MNPYEYFQANFDRLFGQAGSVPPIVERKTNRDTSDANRGGPVRDTGAVPLRVIEGGKR